MLRKTVMIVGAVCTCNKAVLAKYCPDFKESGEILKEISNIILQLMFSADGDYNNLRNSKNTLL